MITEEMTDMTNPPRPVQKYADVMYSYYGTVSHVVPFGRRDDFPGTGGTALCGFEPWLGTGSQDEWDKARRLPLCLRCANLAVKIHLMPSDEVMIEALARSLVKEGKPHA